MNKPLIPQGHELATPAKPGLVVITLTIAMLLSSLHGSDFLRWVMPDLVLMTLLYWGLRTPRLAGVGTAFALGLLMDLIQGGLLGSHSLAYSLAAYTIVGTHRRLEGFTVLGRALQVAPILIGAQILCLASEAFFTRLDLDWRYFLGSLLAGLLWPALVRLLEIFAGPLPTLQSRPPLL